MLAMYVVCNRFVLPKRVFEVLESFSFFLNFFLWIKKLHPKKLWQELVTMFGREQYCWWKKSCTSWYVVYPIIYNVYISQVVSRISSINSITSTTLEFNGLSNFESPLISPKVAPTRQVFFFGENHVSHHTPHMNVAPWHPYSLTASIDGNPIQQILL